jgi:hypothetical protein
MTCFVFRTKLSFLGCKNAVAYYNAGVVAINSKVVGLVPGHHQGCQMIYFQTKNPNLGKFWRALKWKMLTYFTAIWNIL